MQFNDNLEKHNNENSTDVQEIHCNKGETKFLSQCKNVCRHKQNHRRYKKQVEGFKTRY